MAAAVIGSDTKTLFMISKVGFPEYKNLFVFW